MVAGQPAHSPHCLRIAHVVWYPYREHCVRELGSALLWWVGRNLCRRSPRCYCVKRGWPSSSKQFSTEKCIGRRESIQNHLWSVSNFLCSEVKILLAWILAHSLRVCVVFALFFTQFSGWGTAIAPALLCGYAWTLTIFPLVELKLQHRRNVRQRGDVVGMVQVFSFTRSGGDFYSNIPSCLLKNTDASFSSSCSTSVATQYWLKQPTSAMYQLFPKC